MSNNKPKIAIVTGPLMQPRQFSVFEELHEYFDIGIFAIDNPQLLKTYASSITLHVFEDLRDMPGFMRNLEENILDYDIIIAQETSALAAFQALRIAKKWTKPCAIIVHEFHPYFYANYANIRAIQADIFDNANLFLATSSLAESMLKIEGVAQNKIRSLKASINCQRFNRNDVLRKKFRDFIKLKDNEILVAFHNRLEPDTRPMDVLNGFRLLLATNPKLANKVRLLYVGDGSMAKELKYRCIDLKIAGFVSFLHQETEPFLLDLYNATDILVSPRHNTQGVHEEFPSRALEAMACGAVPVVSLGTVLSEYAGNVGMRLQDESFQSIAEALNKLCADTFSLTNESQRTADHMRNNFSLVPGKDRLKLLLDELLTVARNHEAVKIDVTQELSYLSKMLNDNKKEDALVRVESLLLLRDQPLRIRSEVLRYKGDILYQLNRYEEGMEAYSEAISHDDTNYHAYRGLGFIAFKGHSHEESITFFKKALSKKSDDFSSLFGVGLVHRRLGLNEEALFWFEKCIHLRRDDSKVITAMIQACLECTTTEQPRLTLERLIENDEENAALILTLGQVLMKEGKVEEGNELIKKALTLQDRPKTLVA